MMLSIKDFRCFHRTTDIPVRPINILVGENSSGKSSLLAALRFVSDLFAQEGQASFNRDPFFLGSYEQIAHFRGGRFGRAREFSFRLKGDIDRTRVPRIRRQARKAGDTESPRTGYELTVRFINNRSEPATSCVDFSCGDFGFTADFGENIKIKIRTPRISTHETIDKFVRRDVDRLIIDISYLDFILRDLSIIESDESTRKTPRHWFEELMTLAQLYRLAKRDLSANVYATAPVRSRPERTYNPGEATPAPSGEHIPFVLAQIKAFDKELWTEIEKTLNSFGQASGLFEDLNIKRLSHTEGGPFQLIVTLSGAKSNIIDVGYGVSQALPIIADLIRARPGTRFLLQQPEVHLHPRAQAELASFFAQMVQEKKHTLFVETHSDYLIDRIRMEAREGKRIKPDDVSILFFEKTGLDVTIHPISIDSLGNVRGAPGTYRDFFIREEFRSLGVELGPADKRVDA